MADGRSDRSTPARLALSVGDRADFAWRAGGLLLDSADPAELAARVLHFGQNLRSLALRHPAGAAIAEDKRTDVEAVSVRGGGERQGDTNRRCNGKCANNHSCVPGHEEGGG